MIFSSNLGGLHRIIYTTYSVFASWFIFQLMAAFIVFIPIYSLVDNKSIYVKFITAMLLLAIGAMFYHLDLQQLNGKFLPPVSKMLVLPNIWGIAGLLMIGKCISILGLLNVDKQSASKKIVLFIMSFVTVFVGLATDDHIYDFPIGKWGAFQEFSYFITPACGVALTLMCIYIANLLKHNEIIKKITLFLGKNSLDFLLLHFFFIWLVLYVSEVWYPVLSGVEIPLDSAAKCWLHFAGTISFVLAFNSIVIVIKKKLKQ